MINKVAEGVSGAEASETLYENDLNAARSWGALADTFTTREVAAEGVRANEYLAAYNAVGSSETSSISVFPVKAGRVYLLKGVTKTPLIGSGNFSYLLYAFSDAFSPTENTTDKLVRRESANDTISLDLNILDPIAVGADGWLLVTQYNGMPLSLKEVADYEELNDTSVTQLINMRNYGTVFKDTDIIAPLEYFKEVTARGGTLTTVQQRAIVEFVQGLIDAGLASKIISFVPFFGNADTFHLNVFDPKNENTPVQLQPTMFDAAGLIGNACRFVFPYTVGQIAYRDDGQPMVGAGVLLGNKNSWPVPPSTPWIVDGGSGEFNIDYWYSDEKAYVTIGGSAVLDNASNVGAYWWAQREGNDVRVYGDNGLITSINSPTLENKQLRPEILGYIRYYNDLPTDYRTRAIWLARAMYDAEERIFNSLITKFKNTLI